MKKKFFLHLIFFKIYTFAQTGFVSNINTKLKHIHAEVGDNVEVKSTEILNYDASNFIKKITEQTIVLNDFDFKILDNKSSILSDKKKREYLKGFCEKNNISKLIILYRNPFINQYSPYGNLYRLKFDFGILTQERKKNVIYYMNRMILSYYDPKTDTLLPVALSGEDSLYEEYSKQKFNENVVDKNSKKLINSSNVEKDFIEKFERRLKKNFDEVMKR